MGLFRKAYASVTAKTDVLPVSFDVKRVVSEANLPFGFAQVFVPVGTAGVTLLENDPKIYEEYKNWIEAQIPASQDKRPDRRSGSGRNYAHLRAQLVGHSLILPIAEGKLQMSPWQEVVLFDFDDKIGRREFFILVSGEAAPAAAAPGGAPKPGGK